MQRAAHSVGFCVRNPAAVVLAAGWCNDYKKTWLSSSRGAAERATARRAMVRAGAFPRGGPKGPGAGAPRGGASRLPQPPSGGRRDGREAGGEATEHGNLPVMVHGAEGGGRRRKPERETKPDGATADRRANRRPPTGGPQAPARTTDNRAEAANEGEAQRQGRGPGAVRTKTTEQSRRPTRSGPGAGRAALLGVRKKGGALRPRPGPLPHRRRGRPELYSGRAIRLSSPPLAAEMLTGLSAFIDA